MNFINLIEFQNIIFIFLFLIYYLKILKFLNFFFFFFFFDIGYFTILNNNLFKIDFIVKFIDYRKFKF